MRFATTVLACAFAATFNAAGSASSPLTLVSARVSLDGTSNIHAFTASTTDVRVAAVDVDGADGSDLLEHVLQPGALKTFDVVIAAASLSSPKEGIDKNMHKALRVEEYPQIRFSLRSLDAAGADYKASGVLTIAGVDRDVTLNLQVRRAGATLVVSGTTELLMTDFGVKPPKAMLGMLKTNPKVQIRIELALGASLS